MRRLLIPLCAIVLLAGCSNESPTPDPQPIPTSSNRVVLAYLVANNNLEDDILTNVQWMYQSLAEVTDTCTLLVYFKGQSASTYVSGAKILKYQADGHGYINEEPILTGKDRTSQNIIAQAETHDAASGLATDPEVMSTNFEKMKQLAPAKNYGIIFESHGTGWLPAGTSKARSFGQDGSTSNSINMPEMASALETAFPDKNVDFILFDACMMGTAEVCYELRNATRYCIASVMESPADGFPYHLFLNKLYEDEVDYVYVCDETIRFNTQQGSWGTYAVVDCSQMEQLADATKKQLAAHADAVASLDISSLVQYGAYKFTQFSYDMGYLVKTLNGGTMPDEYQQALDKAVTYKICMEESYGGITPRKDTFCGLGMYLPDRSISVNWDAYYPSLAWYTAAGWNSLK